MYSILEFVSPTVPKLQRFEKIEAIYTFEIAVT